MISVFSFLQNRNVTFWSTLYLTNNTKQVINRSILYLPRSHDLSSSPSVGMCHENTPTVHDAGWCGQFNVRQSFCNAEETALRMIAAGQSIDRCKLSLYLDYPPSVSHSILIMKERLQIPRTPRVSLCQLTAVVHSWRSERKINVFRIPIHFCFSVVA
jgi:hypothetical protein